MLERGALLLALILAGGAAAEPLDEERRAELKTLLAHDCGSCHGLTMKGGLGPPLLPPSLSDRDDGLLIDVIMEGVPGTPMPPWRLLLGEDEVAWLVRRLRQGLDDDR